MIKRLLKKELERLKQQGLYRERPREIPAGALNFSSNDYLSLAQDAPHFTTAGNGFETASLGSGGAMGAGGYHAAHLELEEAFAKELHVDRALIFTSGYAANLGLMHLLSSISSHIVCDKSVHASIYDGLKLFEIPFCRFRNDDLQDLQKKLEDGSPPSVVLTEGIAGMSGLKPNLTAMSGLCENHSASLVVDEAHSFGVLGPHGLGAVAEAGLTQDTVPLRLITFSKSLGAQGALLAGEEVWIEGLLQFARSHIYSTAMSPALAYGVLRNFERLMAMDSRRQKLCELIQYFKVKAAQTTFRWEDSDSPIQQLILGCPYRALNYAAGLKQKDIYCLATRTPTVSKKKSGLRIVLNFRHEAQDIDYFFQQLTSIHETQYSVAG